MPRQLEHCTDHELSKLIKDGLDWESTGILPDGILRIEADRIRESFPSIDLLYSRQLCREAALREAAIRWMKLQDALDTSPGSPSPAYEKNETVSPIEMLLAKFHEEIWEGAENGQDYDLAGKDTGKEIIALFQNLTSTSGQ